MEGLGRLPKVVAFGGGHGLSASLTALRRVTDHLTAVVTVADDGGSSGRLRRELGCLPPGDLRMALAALCSDDQEGRTWASVLQSRFTGEGTLAGHAIGNLLIAGLWQQLGDPVAGLDMVADLLRTRGRVLPMSSIPLEIEADVLGLDATTPDELSTLRGQATIASSAGTVQAVRLIPQGPPACREVIEAVMDADSVVLGPGSWFTSVIPHLLVPDLARAITTTSARRVLVLNIAPADETDGFTASRHIELLAEHAPNLRLDVVIADDGFAGSDIHLERYAASLGARLVVADIGVRGGSPRHDTNRLASVFSEVLAL
ncbi:gluconeogenesis factor YvcK family protein [Tessaracoccus antarcticus]|uniref:Putative gluconeogenesis factor n=1 Tax=Tessaracoccus antarcticus TaxID=2479848 RepID=A0A3M0GF94_9ACTN|nr:uridine diphosphate-N-acetylglucosamine-binding protein YvcK [Tessaracoccus antarcticus]RMB60273.1 uridine diphosphate-N-acetylglucosamine-binding protein YvcK [Tessaracoccus antarcticus]